MTGSHDARTALVTGASSGIGLELARQLADRGHNLVLVARRRERLSEIADELRAGRSVRVEVVACDVSDPASRAALVDAVNAFGLTVDLLALSAGFGMGGPFTQQDPDRLQLMMRTNLEAVVMLTRVYAPQMQARGDGAILIVSSMAGCSPMPNFGAYSATKAGVTSFAEMLNEELRGTGVTVTVLCPGDVPTEFAGIASVESARKRIPGALSISAADCARAGLDGLAAGRRQVIPRPAVRLLYRVGQHSPRSVWLPLARRLMA